MDSIERVLGIIAWPSVSVVMLFLFRQQIAVLFSRVTHIRASSKGVELLLQSLEQEGRLPFGSRTELSGLTSHDIWALADFGSNNIPTQVSKMVLAQRVAARSLKDAGLLELEGEGENRKVVLTELARRTLDAAKSLPL